LVILILPFVNTLVVILFAFWGKTFTPPRHKGAKMNISPKDTRFASCLGGAVAIFSPPEADSGSELLN
jgi:hypothetical protein